MAESRALDLSRARETFESSRDFTIGLEEEFAIVDPETLELVDRFEDLMALCREDDSLADSAAGELIASEIEIRSGRAESMAEALELQARRRRALFSVAEREGVALVSAGTHPWASYLDQEIIDTPHYRRLKRDLGWVAQRNNTWSLHVHVGIRGADRAVAVCDLLRQRLPFLLAVSANSPFLDGRDSGLASVRSEIFTRTFPRCGVPEVFGDWASYASFVETLERVGSVVESTQLWWSVRPHHSFGTVEVRICDAQSTAAESSALAGLIVAVVAQTAIDLDEGRAGEPLLGREIEENLWRAIRYGMDGRLIDFEAVAEVEARRELERVLHWTAPARSELGIGVELPERNGAQRARDALREAGSIPEVYREIARQTAATYARGG